MLKSIRRFLNLDSALNPTPSLKEIGYPIKELVKFITDPKKQDKWDNNGTSFDHFIDLGLHVMRSRVYKSIYVYKESVSLALTNPEELYINNTIEVMLSKTFAQKQLKLRQEIGEFVAPKKVVDN